ncbi:hypothetical protein F0U44_21940 [Nocardioides humilatus]|uniref:Ig-like domain repeat protein n=1 Tax=Nocardioides humilatus TaxID=2607660 RepID=A0A5B1L6R0_9ACTN|nr:hypothetical protein [Nocardioides humilatus]KAA1415347.1 hypothetical protein F0U44_21940 [Nocardioides humilatus]
MSVHHRLFGRSASGAALAASILAVAAGLHAAPAHAVYKALTFISVSCTDSVQAGEEVVCTATVEGSSGAGPGTGKVTFGGHNTKPGSVKACLLVEQSPSRSECNIWYRPEIDGTATRTETVTAKYAGDATHKSATGTHYDPATGNVKSGAKDYITVTPAPAPPHMTLTCDGSVPAGGQATCTVYDTLDWGPYFPSGDIVFKSSRPAGFANPKKCTLTHSPEGETSFGSVSCSIVYTPPGAGSENRKDKITATFHEDGTWNELVMNAEIAVPVNSDG